MSQTTAEIVQEGIAIECGSKEGASFLILVSSPSEMERIKRLLELEPVEEEATQPIPTGPFSDLPFDAIRRIIDFVADVDRKHGMGVEALDVILGDVQACARIDGEFDVEAAIFSATCEWDL